MTLSMYNNLDDLRSRVQNILITQRKYLIGLLEAFSIH